MKTGRDVNGTIRRLEWIEEPIQPAWECNARTSIGLYSIPLGVMPLKLSLNGKPFPDSFDTLDQAKDAAQENFDTRVRWAIESA